ncbi:hypothetical protein N9P88_00325 [Planctomycetota bacterium]|nr:hypothetical protein [Planctomycetota bacterium]
MATNYFRLLKRYGFWLEALASQKIDPDTLGQIRFIDVASGKQKVARSDYEIAWVNYEAYCHSEYRRKLIGRIYRKELNHPVLKKYKNQFPIPLYIKRNLRGECYEFLRKWGFAILGALVGEVSPNDIPDIDVKKLSLIVAGKVSPENSFEICMLKLFLPHTTCEKVKPVVLSILGKTGNKALPTKEGSRGVSSSVKKTRKKPMRSKKKHKPNCLSFVTDKDFSEADIKQHHLYHEDQPRDPEPYYSPSQRREYIEPDPNQDSREIEYPFDPDQPDDTDEVDNWD